MKDEERASSPEEAIYATKRTQLHRSMDSLGSSPLPADTPGSAFERVQSLEDLLDCRSSLPSSDREDSGIHTADVSCAVSQADEESGGDPLDLATDLGPHKRQGSELSEQLSPLPPIEETPIEPTDTRAPSDPVSALLFSLLAIIFHLSKFPILYFIVYIHISKIIFLCLVRKKINK